MYNKGNKSLQIYFSKNISANKNYRRDFYEKSFDNHPCSAHAGIDPLHLRGRQFCRSDKQSFCLDCRRQRQKFTASTHKNTILTRKHPLLGTKKSHHSTRQNPTARRDKKLCPTRQKPATGRDKDCYINTTKRYRLDTRKMHRIVSDKIRFHNIFLLNKSII